MKLLDNIIEKIATSKLLQNLLFFGVFTFLFLIMLYFYPLGTGHDLQSHFGRINALSAAILDGNYPVYFDQSMALGYGFATKFFYGDLVLVPFALLVPYVGTVSAYHIMIIFYSFLCGIITYISTNKVFKNRYIAFICTILFTFSYYRLYDVYNRAAVGETICLTFFPLVLWGAYEILKGDYKKWYIITIGFSMMIFAHVNTPAIVAFTLAIFFLFNYKAFLKEPKRLYYLLFAGAFTVLLTAYFVFPLFEQLLSNEFYFNTENGNRITFNVLKGEDFKHMFRGLFVGTTYMFPEIGGIGITITTILLFRMFIKKNDLVKRGDLFLVIGLVCLFIVSPLYPWTLFPFNILGFIQFSFRFYSVATFAFCIAGAIYFYTVFQNDKRRYLVGIPFVTIFTALLIINSGQVYSNNYATRTQVVATPSFDNNYFLMGADYMPSKMPEMYEFIRDRANDSIRSIDNDATIDNFERKLRLLSFDAKVVNGDHLELPLTYYKGYKGTLDDEEIDINQSENGLIEVPINKSGHVKVYFGGTLIQKTSPYITLVMSILLIAYIIWYNRKERE